MQHCTLFVYETGDTKVAPAPPKDVGPTKEAVLQEGHAKSLPSQSAKSYVCADTDAAGASAALARL